MFESARALSLHLAQSPACKQFANEHDRKRNARKLSFLNAVIVVQSSKPPTQICRDFVSNITHIIQRDFGNEVLNDWSDINFPDMYDDKMDAYEHVDATDLSAQEAATDCSLLEGDDVFVLSQDKDKFTFAPSKRSFSYVYV